VKLLPAVLLLLFVLPSAAGCRKEQTARVAPAAIDSPYAGQTDRDIKALSPEQIDDYLQGRGMGFALAAELNAFPGPRHVLDAAAPLALTPQQLERINSIFERMAADASSLGRKLVEKERDLDRLFAGGTAAEPTVATVTSEIGALLGELRFVHLRAHLETTRILSQEQIATYQELRGYHGSASGHPAGGHHHQH
jgi:hypothetical protein